MEFTRFPFAFSRYSACQPLVKIFFWNGTDCTCTNIAPFPHIVAGVRHALELPLSDILVPLNVALDELLKIEQKLNRLLKSSTATD